MTPILYTDTDSVRSLLELTEQDLSDQQMHPVILEAELLVALRKWLPTHSTVYAAGVADSATDDQRHALRLLQLYAHYICAAWVIGTAALSLPKEISDGKNTIKRFDSDEAVQALRSALFAKAAAYKNDLLSALGGAAVPVKSPLLGVAPSYDPVTNK